MSKQKEIGLIGYPLSHSFSRNYFINKFQEEGITDFSYLNFEIDNIDKIIDIVTDNKNLIGLNVTIPHKQSVIPYLHQLSYQAGKIGAVNTICIDRTEKKPRLVGHNTDCIGFNISLDKISGVLPNKALVLGSGGASRAITYVLEQRKIPYLLISRSQDNNKLSYRDIDASIIKKYPLIINTTPLGMFPEIEMKPDIPYEFLGIDHCLVDLIYNPAQTLFLQLGKKAGARTMNGMPMLIAQAEASWKLWSND